MTRTSTPSLMDGIEAGFEKSNHEFSQRKVVQIAVGGSSSSMGQLYALCSDGTIWSKSNNPKGSYWTLETPKAEPSNATESDALAILVASLDDEKAAPTLTDFFETVFAQKLGKAPTQAQCHEIKNSVTAMVQSPPDQRTLSHFMTLLRDPDVIFACSSAMGDSEALALYFQS
ncbi:hypothetical protein ACI77O_12420 [Pseudomonas tritici]|uniref:hypothetical protein n=1 Tax=Pseudomonas tritici TaxID=2745518 RepID=UPI00387ABA0D